MQSGKRHQNDVVIVNSLGKEIDRIERATFDLKVSDMLIQAKQGAVLLDERQPDWVERIDLSQLNMENCEMCIAGQVFFDEDEGETGYDWLVEEMTTSGEWEGEDEAIDHGFLLGDHESWHWAALGDAWGHIIMERKNG